jgi:hypothetical protein
VAAGVVAHRLAAVVVAGSTLPFCAYLTFPAQLLSPWALAVLLAALVETRLLAHTLQQEVEH